MRYFPAFFDVKDRAVFVIGGGEMALRKARLLAKAGARLFIFSASKQGPLRHEFGRTVSLFERPLSGADFILDPALVIAASEDEAVNAAAGALARARHVPVNVVDRPDLCDVVVPSIVERGDITIGISTGGAAPVLGRRLRERIESLLPARLGELVSFARERRPMVADAVPHKGRRAFWERLFAGPVAEAVLDGDMEGADHGFKAALARAGEPAGAIHIVGAGPGDPELLTLKALRVLQEADVVLYDNLVSEDVLELIRRDAERRYVGKRKADHFMAQEDIGRLMIELASSGKRVVRLKGGDPYIFGRGGEELDAVKTAGLTATVIPGITAASGCAASSSVPLTHRGLSQAVTYVTAQAGGGGAPDVDWAALARLKHTIVVYMGVGRAADVASSLAAGGLDADTPVAIVENGTLPDQRIIRTRLDDLGAAVKGKGVKGPAVLIIGAVAGRAAGPGFTEFLREEALAA